YGNFFRQKTNPVEAAACCSCPSRHFPLPQSSSASRVTAGAFGLFILCQSGERPERYGESFLFDTMPSSPILHAWAKTVGPSPSICSLNRMPGRALATIDASVAPGCLEAPRDPVGVSCAPYAAAGTALQACFADAR